MKKDIATVRKSLLKASFIAVFIMLAFPGLAQPSWTYSPTDFAQSGEVDAVVLMNSSEVSSGYLGAFVGDECRGYIDGQYFSPSDHTIFSLLIYSNVSSGEVISFRYYDAVNDKYYNIAETVTFAADMILGDALNPVVFNTLANSAPVATCPDKADLAAAPGPIYFDLCAIFSDPDSDPLTYSEEHSGGSTVNWLSACELEFTTAASGTSTLTLTASDGSLSANCDYSFTINPANNPPVADNPLGVIKLQEGFSSSQIDLDTVFSDPDGDGLNYSVSSGNTAVITASVSGSILTMTEVAPGNSVLTVTATDGQESVIDQASVILFAEGPALPWSINTAGFSYSGEIDAVVQINGAEVTSGTIGAFVGNECRGIVEGIFFPVSGRTIFTLMLYSNLSSGEYFTFRYHNDITSTVYKLDEIMTFESDMQIGDALTPYVFNNNQANNMPLVVSPISDQVLNEHFGTQDISLDGRFSDPDSDVLTYSATSSNTSVASVAISGNTLTITEKGLGTGTIVVRASDGALCIDDRFTLTVTNVNDPPVVDNPVPDQNLLEGFGSKNISLAGVFYDPDGTALDYSVSSNNTEVVSVSVSGGYLVLTEKGNGSADITVCASDGVNSVCDQFVVIVDNVNDPPVASCESLEDKLYVEGFGSASVDNLCAVFTDPDSDNLTYSASSNNSEVATAEFNGCTLDITEKGTGSADITVCASDGDNSACCTFSVTVEVKNIIDCYDEDRQLFNEDSIEICEADTSLILIVYSDKEWSIESSENWVTTTKTNKYNATITAVANTTGANRTAWIVIKDTQLNELNLILYQYHKCIPDGVFSPASENVKVYPNPVSASLNISLNNSNFSGELEISVFDATGILHKKQKVLTNSAGDIQLDMSDLANGTWFIIIRGEKVNETIKIPVIKLVQ